jgi:hypothetical protein
MYIGLTIKIYYLPHNIDQLAFVVETHCVFFEVEAEFLAVIWMNSNLQRFKGLKYRTASFCHTTVIGNSVCVCLYMCGRASSVRCVHTYSVRVCMFMHMKDACVLALVCV